MIRTEKIKIAVFASGSGSNFENLCIYFKNHPRIQIVHLFCNNANAFAIERAKNNALPSTIFNKLDFYQTDKIKLDLAFIKADYIVLAGFLWLVPSYLVKLFPNKIINIHPALLPKYGGKGMYGSYVHQAVFEAKEKETGITIHLVNEKYDEGAIIFQAATLLTENDTPASIAQQVHALEYQNFPKEIEKFILKNQEI
jgi:phosphoribosylglycinamide formyltransferase 1